ncbi:hypothetical protein PPROV_000862800 [Pycnococcus provasolii]|uniref:Uncharacterized protein n=1 Tax=Pycnococcus provasolii TaxID=41880 RepID=A0A830HTA1_9CHLO|nr:hypothetical protein PPROV_000862800 [Pycnococcus provasolii]
MANYIGNKFNKEDEEKFKDFESRADPDNRDHATLLEEMRLHTKKLRDMRKNEDPRLSFCTPEFREAQRVFTENFKKNFGKPVEWALVKKYPWSEAHLQKLDVPVDVDGNPWPLDDEGKPIVEPDPPEEDFVMPEMPPGEYNL